MKLKVSLSYGVMGEALPSVEGRDMDRLDLAKAPTPRAACRAAARALRQAAARMDLLGDQPEPFREATHRRVNRTAVQ